MGPEMAERVGNAIRREFRRDAALYEEGKCPELAIALTRSIKGAGILVCTRSWKDALGERQNKLSHVVAECGLFDFDAGGLDACSRWEERWEGDYSDKPDEDVSFSWDRMTESSLEKRVGRCRDGDEKINWRLVGALETRVARAVPPSILARPQPRALRRPETGKGAVRGGRRGGRGD